MRFTKYAKMSCTKSRSAAAGTIEANAVEPLESRGFKDSRAKPDKEEYHKLAISG